MFECDKATCRSKVRAIFTFQCENSVRLLFTNCQITLGEVYNVNALMLYVASPSHTLTHIYHSLAVSLNFDIVEYWATLTFFPDFCFQSSPTAQRKQYSRSLVHCHKKLRHTLNQLYLWIFWTLNATEYIPFVTRPLGKHWDTGWDMNTLYLNIYTKKYWDMDL